MVLCKDAKGKCGVSFYSVNKGVFVCFVQKNSPAAIAGVRFGDQILTVSSIETIDGVCSNGYVVMLLLNRGFHQPCSIGNQRAWKVHSPPWLTGYKHLVPSLLTGMAC